MPDECIRFQESIYFTSLIKHYLDKNPALDSLYQYYPSIENLEFQIQLKQKTYCNDTRKTLVNSIKKQCSNVMLSSSSTKNIEALLLPTTFTVTTGHQLNLFTGPLYFLYKIISTINLCKKLENTYPKHQFVPIYWMATEDHDFDEINYFQFKNKKIKWEFPSSGAVGLLHTESLNSVLEQLRTEFGTSNNAIFLVELFEDSYLKSNNLADAMRYLVNNLFGEYGLVILDANDYDLKEKFVPIIQSELVEQKTNQLVNATTEVLKNYTIQVNPREINLFYLKNNLRERIILENEIYKINNTDIIFTKEEIIAQTENFPERFSPNVILRPLYQEVILPNLAYIGGGGEIAYWLELKSVFDYYNTTFPMLIVRNSVVITTEKLEKKRNKLQLSWSNLFQNQVNLVNLKMQELSKFPLNFDTQKTHLKNQFSELLKIAEQTDKSFLGAVLAQQSKQIKGLENLEKRLLKAEKKAHKLKLEQVTDLQNRLFPNQELQERQLNFAEFYLEYGSKLIPLLIEKLIPLDTSFEIIVLP